MQSKLVCLEPGLEHGKRQHATYTGMTLLGGTAGVVGGSQKRTRRRPSLAHANRVLKVVSLFALAHE
jgi:hypothetical protein